MLFDTRSDATNIMPRLLVFGNSGSGKSTLAARIAQVPGLKHLDLDTIAWKPGQPGVRESLNKSYAAIDRFCVSNANWVVEGCYSTLLEYTADSASEIVFLNPGVDACQANCRARPWEPHKYSSPAAQDRNLAMLLDWVASYETRDDEFSLQHHIMLFASFDGAKTEVCSNEEAETIANRFSPRT